jgi:hypothetical protein
MSATNNKKKKAASLSADERRLHKGEVIVTKFLSYLNTTDAEGLLVLRTVENGEPALLTITSGASWLADLRDLAQRAPQPRVALHLPARQCVVVPRADLRKLKKGAAAPLRTPWFAKLPLQGVYQRVCDALEGREAAASERALRESVAAYFGSGAAEDDAIERVRDSFELDTVPADVYLDFPPLTRLA